MEITGIKDQSAMSVTKCGNWDGLRPMMAMCLSDWTMEPTWQHQQMSKSFITSDKLLRIDAAGNVLEGSEGLRPSSEIKMHLRCYEKREDVCAVVHAHPPAATGFAVAHRPMDMYNMIEMSQPSVRFR